MKTELPRLGGHCRLEERQGKYYVIAILVHVRNASKIAKNLSGRGNHCCYGLKRERQLSRLYAVGVFMKKYNYVFFVS